MDADQKRQLAEANRLKQLIAPQVVPWIDAGDHGVVVTVCLDLAAACVAPLMLAGIMGREDVEDIVEDLRRRIAGKLLKGEGPGPGERVH